MSGNHSGSNGKASIPVKTERRRTPWPLALVAALFVLAAFLTWYGTWFGRTLSDEDIGSYLGEETKPRKVQHALSQIAERIDRHDESVKRWYPQVAALAASPVTEIRLTVAWVLGHDNTSEEFHRALLRLLDDREPVVRRNAAVQLVRFKDSRGLPELRATLKPYEVAAPIAGRVENALSDGSKVSHGTLLAKIEKADHQVEELRSPLPGVVMRTRAQENQEVREGENLFSIAPDAGFVWEALRALYMVGETEDLEEVERYARGVEHMPEDIKKQAALTAQAIKDRSASTSSNANAQ